MKHVFLFLFYVGLSIITSLFGGYVLACMWEWFIVPVFTTAPHLDYLHAVGLGYVLNFPLVFTNSRLAHVGDKQEGTWTTMFSAMITLVVTYAFLLLGASIWHQFIH